MSLLEKALKKIEELKKIPDKKITPRIEKIPEEQKKPKKPKIRKEEICPTCNKIHKIFQDKDMNKSEIINWFTKYLVVNKENFTLDWLRGQKLTFESVNEMRK